MEPREFHRPFGTVYSWFASLMEPAYADIARRTPMPEDAETLLDAGGGDGRLAAAFAKLYPGLSLIVTADISRDMAGRAQRIISKRGLSARIRSEVQDVHHLSYADGSFDVVVSFASLHHWREPVKALLELDRVLKSGGLLSIFDGCDRPSFEEVRRAVSRFGGVIPLALIYWIGTKDVLSREQVARVVDESRIGYLSISRDGPLLIVSGVKG